MTNHPNLKQLQDYFENEKSNFDNDQLKKHLGECDKCSLVLSEMAKVDILFSKTKATVEVTELVKNETLSKANTLIAQIRIAKNEKIERKEKRIEKVTSVITDINEIRRNALSELKLPALQAAAAMLVLGIVTEYARTSTEVENYKIFNDEVTVVYSELQGENNEDN
jgi:hypothetical protein